MVGAKTPIAPSCQLGEPTADLHAVGPNAFASSSSHSSLCEISACRLAAGRATDARTARAAADGLQRYGLNPFLKKRPISSPAAAIAAKHGPDGFDGDAESLTSDGGITERPVSSLGAEGAVNALTERQLRSDARRANEDAIVRNAQPAEPVATPETPRSHARLLSPPEGMPAVIRRGCGARRFVGPHANPDLGINALCYHDGRAAKREP